MSYESTLSIIIEKPEPHLEQVHKETFSNENTNALLKNPIKNSKTQKAVDFRYKGICTVYRSSKVAFCTVFGNISIILFKSMYTVVAKYLGHLSVLSRCNSSALAIAIFTFSSS